MEVERKRKIGHRGSRRIHRGNRGRRSRGDREGKIGHRGSLRLHRGKRGKSSRGDAENAEKYLPSHASSSTGRRLSLDQKQDFAPGWSFEISRLKEE